MRRLRRGAGQSIPRSSRCALRTPWRDLTPYFRLGGRLQFTSDSDPLKPPWPDLLIATGRHSVAASILVRRLSRGKTRTVQIQNPVISPRHFDLDRHAAPRQSRPATMSSSRAARFTA